MIRRVQVGDITFGEFLETIREDQKADLIDGVIHMTSPENTGHNDLVSWFDRLLGGFVEELDLGKVTVNRVAYRLGERQGPEPDIAFVRADRLKIVKYGFIAGPPDLAIEIVSPESVIRDYEMKRRQYEEGGVQEYLIFDPIEEASLFLCRIGDRFVEAKPKDHVFRSSVVPGFYVDPRWLWRRPLPRTRPILDAMLESARRTDTPRTRGRNGRSRPPRRPG